MTVLQDENEQDVARILGQVVNLRHYEQDFITMIENDFRGHSKLLSWMRWIINPEFAATEPSYFHGTVMSALPLISRFGKWIIEDNNFRSEAGKRKGEVYAGHLDTALTYCGIEKEKVFGDSQAGGELEDNIGEDYIVLFGVVPATDNMRYKKQHKSVVLCEGWLVVQVYIRRDDGTQTLRHNDRFTIKRRDVVNNINRADPQVKGSPRAPKVPPLKGSVKDATEMPSSSTKIPVRQRSDKEERRIEKKEKRRARKYDEHQTNEDRMQQLTVEMQERDKTADEPDGSEYEQMENILVEEIAPEEVNGAGGANGEFYIRLREVIYDETVEIDGNEQGLFKLKVEIPVFPSDVLTICLECLDDLVLYPVITKIKSSATEEWQRIEDAMEDPQRWQISGSP